MFEELFEWLTLSHFPQTIRTNPSKPRMDDSSYTLNVDLRKKNEIPHYS